jgi:hypothetical protein
MLVGETLMAQADIAAAVEELLGRNVSGTRRVPDTREHHEQ